MSKDAAHPSRLHEKTNHDRHVKNVHHPHSKTGHDRPEFKSAKQDRHDSDSSRLRDRKRKRSDENVKEVSRSVRRNESRVHERNRDQREDREKDIDRARDNSRRRRARSVQRAKEALFKSKMSPPNSTRDKYDRMRRSRSITPLGDRRVSKSRDRLRQSDLKTKTNHTKEKLSDRDSSKRAIRTSNDDRFRKPEPKSMSKDKSDIRSSKSSVSKHRPDDSYVDDSKRKRIGKSLRPEDDRAKPKDIEMDLEEGEVSSLRTETSLKPVSTVDNGRRKRVESDNGTEPSSISFTSEKAYSKSEDAEMDLEEGELCSDEEPSVPSKRPRRKHHEHKQTDKRLNRVAAKTDKKARLLMVDTSSSAESHKHIKNPEKDQGQTTDFKTYEVPTSNSSVKDTASESVLIKKNDGLLTKVSQQKETSRKAGDCKESQSTPVNKEHGEEDPDPNASVDKETTHTENTVSVTPLGNMPVPETLKSQGINMQSTDTLSTVARPISKALAHQKVTKVVDTSSVDDRPVSKTLNDQETMQGTESISVAPKTVFEILEDQEVTKVVDTRPVCDKSVPKIRKDQRSLQVADTILIVTKPVCEVLEDQEVTKVAETSPIGNKSVTLEDQRPMHAVGTALIDARHVSEHLKGKNTMQMSSDVAKPVTETLKEQDVTQTTDITSDVPRPVLETSGDQRHVQEADLVSGGSVTVSHLAEYDVNKQDEQGELVCENIVVDQEVVETMEFDDEVQSTGLPPVSTERTLLKETVEEEEDSSEINVKGKELLSQRPAVGLSTHQVAESVRSEIVTGKSEVTITQTNYGATLSEKSNSSDVASTTQNENSTGIGGMTLNTTPADSSVTHHKASVLQDKQRLTDTPSKVDLIKASSSEVKVSPPERELEKSNSPPLRYEFSPHFIETIDAPMRRQSMLQEPEHSESSCGSVQSGSSATSEELDANTTEDPSNTGQKDPLTLTLVRKHLFNVPDSDDSLTRTSFGNQQGDRLTTKTSTDLQSNNDQQISFDTPVVEETNTDSRALSFQRTKTHCSEEYHTENSHDSIEDNPVSTDISLDAKASKVMSIEDSSTGFSSTGFVPHETVEDSRDSGLSQLSKDKAGDLDSGDCRAGLEAQSKHVGSVVSSESPKKIAEVRQAGKIQEDGSSTGLLSQEGLPVGAENSCDIIQNTVSPRNAASGTLDSKTNTEPSGKTDESSGVVSMEELMRLEAEAERALDIIFTSRFPERIQKLKTGEFKSLMQCSCKGRGGEPCRRNQIKNNTC